MKLIQEQDGSSVGIYVIENLTNGHFYIGQADGLRRRFNEHSSLLERGKHDNTHLQRAYQKYGSEGFVMFMMQSCPEADLNRIEQEWVDLFWDGCKTCYNIKVVANKPPNRKGAKLTPEQLQRWSDVKKGKRFTEEHKRKIGESHKGQTYMAKTFDVRLQSPTGEVFGPITNLNQFAKTHNLLAQGLGALIRGKISQTKGWKLIP